MQLIDTHTHLTFPPLERDPDAVLARAAAAGVTDVVVPAYDVASWNPIAVMAARPTVHPAYGLHPWVADQPLDLDALAERLRSGAAAVGEIGLDFKIPSPDRGTQIAVCRDQVALAVEMDLPVILHNRGAFAEMIDILAVFRGRLRGVVHAFSRGSELARRFLDLDLHLAFGGAVTRPRAKQARRSAVVCPGDRLLLETDSPSIGLEDVPPERTEPRHVRDIAAALAELRGTDPESIARITTGNARRLFRLP